MNYNIIRALRSDEIIPDYTPPIRDLLAKICKDKIIADLACGYGWAGTACLMNGAKFSKFADARISRLNKHNLKDFKNYSLSFIDLNNPNLFKDLLHDVDVVLYFGHLYHATNHEEILNFILSSNATEFVIDSKMFVNQDNETPSIEWLDEPTDDEFNICHDTETSVNIGRPNLAWLLTYLEEHNLNIIEVIQTKSVNNQGPIHEFINFTVYCSKK